MTTRRTELPGVGTKHTLELSTEDQLVIVEHRVGQWELARVDTDGQSTTLLRLSLDEGSELGRILSRGEVEREDSRRQIGLEEFALEWVTLEARSVLVGTTLLEAGIRERTGVSVIALIRGERSAPSPSPETRFEAGDTLILIGQREDLERFIEQFAPPASGS